MSESKLVKEGKYAVLRDSAGNIVTRVVSKDNEREDWRSILRRMTNNGQNQFQRIVEIADGVPFEAKLSDGRTSEPIIPPITAQLQAGQFLLEMMHGKAVAQTEMRKAEAETKLVEQFRALSDSELKAKVIDALAKKNALPQGPPEQGDTDGNESPASNKAPDEG